MSWGDPFEEMRRFQREINKTFNKFWGVSEPEKLAIGTGIQSFRKPLSDIKETDKELVASLEIPGVDKKDIQLNVTENTLEVKVEKKSAVEIEEGGYIRAERSYRGFYRSINLPTKVIPDQIKATYKDGVLEVVMPKVEERKSKRRITIE